LLPLSTRFLKKKNLSHKNNESKISRSPENSGRLVYVLASFSWGYLPAFCLKGYQGPPPPQASTGTAYPAMIIPITSVLIHRFFISGFLMVKVFMRCSIPYTP
jgi:hypothetical protein